VEEGELASGGGKKRRHLIPIRRLGTRERNVDRPAVGATPHHTYPCHRAVASFVRCQSGHAERVQIRVRAATYRAVAWRLERANAFTTRVTKSAKPLNFYKKPFSLVSVDGQFLVK
jgi:hypothetical protein